MKLTYRLVEEGDLPALQRLWEEEAGWGKFLTPELRRYLTEDVPLGGVSGTVAVDTETEQIVGQFAFIPSLVYLNGREVRAFRPAAPIVARSVRFRTPNPLSHPSVAMYLHAVKALRARGEGLLYMVPNARWLRFLRMFPNLYCGTFPLWSMPLPLQSPLPLGEGFAAAPLVAWDERVDRLWDKASRLHNCSVVRDSRTLPWKLGRGNYEVLNIERNGEMVGLVASRQKGDRQWLICDLLAADAGESLRATLAAACNVGHAESVAAGAEKPVHKVAVLVTPVMEESARALGFVRDAYDFPLAIHKLDKSITEEEVDPARWYVSAND